MSTLGLLCLFVSFIPPCCAAIQHYFKKIESKTPQAEQVKNIDFIYMINLDERPEKLQRTLEELAPYGIYPERFPAIYGWNLTKRMLDGLGIIFLPGMDLPLPVMTSELMFRCARGPCGRSAVFLRDLYGQTIFSTWLSLGGIGCTLSHLSVLQDAYDAGYETIWVIEDDIAVKEDPRRLTDLIDRLDALRGPEGWDVLYTDPPYEPENKIGPFLEALPWLWRPDLRVDESIRDTCDAGENFMNVGNRIGTHSLIIRRSGMKKILDFYATHPIFVPYDREIALIPGIRLFMPKHAIVSVFPGFSDTKNWVYKFP